MPERQGVAQHLGVVDEARVAGHLDGVRPGRAQPVRQLGQLAHQQVLEGAAVTTLQRDAEVLPKLVEAAARA